MAREPGAAKNKFFKTIGMMGAIFTLISSVALIALLIVTEFVFDILIDENGPRTYWVQFESEDRILLDMKYKRGEKLDKPADPKHSEDEYFEFTFRGWDFTGDKVPDIIPNRVYYSFLAVAVYQKKQIKPFPSSEPESSEPEDSSNDYSSTSDISSELGVSYGQYQSETYQVL